MLSSPTKNSSLFLLYADFNQKHHMNQSYTQFGHTIWSVGFNSFKKGIDHDHKLAYVYQNHVKHHTSSGKTNPVSANLIDFDIGKYFWLKNKSHRVGVRYILADANFVGILEDYYNLGTSGLIQSRNNLEQFRFKFQRTLSETESIWLEWIQSYEHSREGLVRHSGENKRKSLLYQELDLSYRNAWNKNWVGLAGLNIVKPYTYSSGDDLSYGFFARFTYNH